MTAASSLTLRGIGPAIGALFKVEPKVINLSLEDQINKALAEEREKIRPSRDDIDTFSWVTGDNNPIHRLQKRARKLGFDDIPVMGAHLAAYGEQYVEGVVQHMREYWGADINVIGQENKFRAPLYPGERILWQVNKFTERNNHIELDIEGSVKDKKIIGISSILGSENPIMPQLAGPIYSRRYLLDADHLDEFYNCVGGKNTGQVPHMLPASFVPATLLNLLEEKTQTLEGTNMKMAFDFLAEAQPGRLQVDLFPPRKPSERRGMFIYKFRTLVSQDTKPITYGEMSSAISQKVDFYN